MVLENSDHESEAHARGQFERLLEAALEQGCVLDAVVAESIAQARALWHIRESIPLAQAQEGLNIKHDISIAVSRIPEFVRRKPTHCWRQHFPGARLVNYGHLGDGNLHYNVQAPDGADAEAFLRDQEGPINTLVYDMVDRYRGSISRRARHWQPEAREAGAPQIAGGAAGHARHQGGAGPAQPDEPGPGAINRVAACAYSTGSRALFDA